MDTKEFDKIIDFLNKKYDKDMDLYKMNIYKQKILINQLKYRLYNEEIIKKSYLNKLNILSKL